MVQEPLTQGSDSQEAGERYLLGYVRAKALQQALQMGNDALIMSFVPEKDLPYSKEAVLILTNA